MPLRREGVQDQGFRAACKRSPTGDQVSCNEPYPFSYGSCTWAKALLGQAKTAKAPTPSPCPYPAARTALLLFDCGLQDEHAQTISRFLIGPQP